MKKIDFTIVIPVHNGMPYIKDCVRSALSQKYKNYNIIILENASNDGTTEFLDSLNHEKICVIKSTKLLSIEENWARIKDLQLNEYMTILMADDFLHKNYLSSVVKMIKKHPNCNIYRTNINLMNDKSKVFHVSNIKEKITIYDYLEGRLSHTYTETAAGYCLKTSRYKEIGGIDCKYRLMHTDDKLVMEAIGKNNYMAVAPEHAVNYRCHSGSESGSPDTAASLGGYNYWLNWIYGLKDNKLTSIVTKWLPFHLKQIERFFSPDVMQEHKKIYDIYKTDINVCLATDENYVKYMATVIYSILTSANENDMLHFYILCNNVSAESKQIVNSLKKEKSCEITFIDLDIKEFEDFPAGGPHISNTTYFRYKIAELLPDVSKIIYLDCDMIVKQSLAELFNTDLTDFYIGGVEDVGYYYWKDFNPEFIYKDGFYINAGMLLINMEQWKKQKLFKKLIDFTVKESNNIRIGDQDVINRVCLNKIKKIDYKWNVQDSFYRLEPEVAYNPNKNEIIQAAQNPAIIHYTNFRKPWADFGVARVKDFWDCYIKTPFCSNSEKLAQSAYFMLSEKINEYIEKNNMKSLRYRIVRVLSHITFGRVKKYFINKKNKIRKKI